MAAYFHADDERHSCSEPELDGESKRGRTIEKTRTLVAQAVRANLGFDGRLTRKTCDDACEQVGVHPSALRRLFPTDDDLLDRVNAMLVHDCATRLRTDVDAFVTPEGGDELAAAAQCLAHARPVDRATLVIRAERRLTALRSSKSSPAVAAAERTFVVAITDVIAALLTKVGREFSWRPELAVRVILDTYERSFEAWVLRGHDDTDFHTSPYAERTLPTLLRNLTVDKVAPSRRHQ